MNKHDETADSGDSAVVRSHYDWSSIYPSTAVVTTMATATDRHPTDLDPLHESIDPDALDKAVESMDVRQSGNEHIRFWYEGYQVAIDPVDGAVSVQTGEEPPG